MASRPSKHWLLQRWGSFKSGKTTSDRGTVHLEGTVLSAWNLVAVTGNTSVNIKWIHFAYLWMCQDLTKEGIDQVIVKPRYYITGVVTVPCSGENPLVSGLRELGMKVDHQLENVESPLPGSTLSAQQGPYLGALIANSGRGENTDGDQLMPEEGKWRSTVNGGWGQRVWSVGTTMATDLQIQGQDWGQES